MIVAPTQARTAGLVPGAPGTPYRGATGRRRLRTLTDSAGEAQQVDVVTVLTTVETASDYSLRVLSSTAGVPFDRTYTVTTASTAGTALQTLFINALLADPELGLVVRDVVALTSLTFRITWAAGVSGTVTDPLDPGSDVSIASTAAGWTQYAYGTFVELAADGGIQPISAAGGPSITYTVTTNASGALARGTIYLDGVAYPWQATAGASSGATAIAIEAAVDAALPAQVDVSVSGDVVTALAPAGSTISSSPVSETSTLVITPAAVAATRFVPGYAFVVRDSNTAMLESSTYGLIEGPTGPRPGHGVQVALPAEQEWSVALTSGDGAPSLGAPVYATSSGLPLVTPIAGSVRIAGAIWVTDLASAVGAVEF